MAINPFIKYSFNVISRNNNIPLDTSSYIISYDGDDTYFNYPGKKTFIAEGKNLYFGKILSEIELYVKIDDSSTNVELDSYHYTYNGKNIIPNVTVLVNGTIIALEYSNYTAYTVTRPSESINASANPYTITISSSNSSLGGSVSKKYYINKLELTNENTRVDVVSDFIKGNNNVIHPTINNIIVNTNIEVSSENYELEDVKDNKLPGDASIKIIGIHNCTGEKIFNYIIYADISECKINPTIIYEYTGNIIYCNKSDVNLNWYGYNVPPANYTIEYDASSDYKYPGQKNAKITSSNIFYLNDLLITYNINCDINKCDFSSFKACYLVSELTDINDILNTRITLNGLTLRKNEDYNIECDKPNITTEHKEITISGIGCYYGIHTIECDIIDNSTTIITYTDNSRQYIYNLVNLTRSALSRLNAIREFIAGSSITTISNNIFKDCVNLERADFSKCEAEIPEGAFENCTNLLDVIFNT